VAAFPARSQHEAKVGNWNHNETHLSTEKAPARSQTGLSRPHEFARRPRRHLAPPRQGPPQIDPGLNPTPSTRPLSGGFLFYEINASSFRAFLALFFRA